MCRATGKRRLRDHREATRVLRKCSNARSTAKQEGVDCRRHEVRTYECESCHGWHLTSWVAPDSRYGARAGLDPEVFRAFLMGARAAAWVPAA